MIVKIFLRRKNVFEDYQPDSGAAFKRSPNGGMCFKLLESFEGMEVGIGIVQADDKSHGAEIVVSEMVQERTTVSFRIL